MILITIQVTDNYYPNKTATLRTHSRTVDEINWQEQMRIMTSDPRAQYSIRVLDTEKK
jgi:hypothetical protein